MRVILVSILCIVLLVGLCVFIYYLIYARAINQKIQSGEKTGRRMIDIPKVLLIAVIVALVLYSGVLQYSIQTQANAVSRNLFAVIDVTDPEKYEYAAYFGNVVLDDASFAQVYSIEANPGYEKQVAVDGDFQFTIFTGTTPADSFHPDFLCYVEYIGEEENLVFCDMAGFQAIDDEGGAYAAGSSGWEASVRLYIGNLDDNCQFTIHMYALDEAAETAFWEANQQAMEEDKGDFPSEQDYATSTGSAVITVNRTD